jgi:transcriptional regulator with XRE-family HTH domain
MRSESLSEVDWVDAAWIRTKLGGSGKTQRDLARVLGIDASGVSRLLDGRRKLGADEARTIRAFFDGAAPGSAPTATDGQLKESMPKRNLPGPKPRTRLSADIPILGPIVPDGPDHFRLPDGPPAEHRPCPPQCVGVTGAFGIFLPDDALAPRARAGEVLYVHPNKPPIANVDVFVLFKSPADRIAILRCLDGDDRSLRFVSVTAVRPPQPSERPFSIERDQIAQIGRIVLIAME